MNELARTLTRVGPALVLSCAFAMAACGEKPQRRIPSDTPPPSSDLPGLKEVDLEIPEGDRPIVALNTLALTAHGTITYRSGLRRDTILTTIDSTGRVIARWGRRGEGPGELRGDELLLSGDSLIAAVGVDGERVRVFDPLGRLAAERSDVPSGLPSDLSDGRTYWWRSFRVGEGPRRPASRGRLEPFEGWCILSACREVMLHETDSVLKAIHQAATPMLHGAWPAFGAYGDRFVVANGYDYTLWLYRMGSRDTPARFGRDLPPRMATAAHIARAESSWAKLERTGMPGPGGQRIHENFDAERAFLREAPLPHFQYGDIKFDGHGRMWVIGKTGDSTFFDIFADTTFLGRIALGCRRMGHAASVRGHWLAIGCETDDELDQFVIRLFRITEPVDS